jgi:hypothetical protein
MAPTLKRLLRNHAFRRVRTGETSMKTSHLSRVCKEAKYDMAVRHLLLKSFWANEAVFQMMMLCYNLFLLLKF